MIFRDRSRGVGGHNTSQSIESVDLETRELSMRKVHYHPIRLVQRRRRQRQSEGINLRQEQVEKTAHSSVREPYLLSLQN